MVASWNKEWVATLSSCFFISSFLNWTAAPVLIICFFHSSSSSSPFIIALLLFSYIIFQDTFHDTIGILNSSDSVPVMDKKIGLAIRVHYFKAFLWSEMHSKFFHSLNLKILSKSSFTLKSVFWHLHFHSTLITQLCSTVY